MPNDTHVIAKSQIKCRSLFCVSVWGWFFV